MRKGAVNLPLHYGSCPSWLFKRMKEISGEILDIIIYEYGTKEVLNRITEPYWFQAFGCVVGFDWHSSGVTTTVCGALKEAINQKNYDITICGGKGAASRKTPEQIKENSRKFGLSEEDVNELVYSSRMIAKVDNNLVQDGYQLYCHYFIFTDKKEFGVVQQGMNVNNKYARRYHWLSDNLKEFVEEPHAGICCDKKEEKVLDMTSKNSKEARKASVDLVKDNPVHLKKYFSNQRNLIEFSMPEHHEVLNFDISKKGWQTLQKAYEIQPKNYEELVSLKGIGAKTIRALALVSDIIYGASPSWEDPVKYSFAHGGKDGYPYKINKKHYDKSIQILREAVEKAKINQKEKLNAIKRLSSFL